MSISQHPNASLATNHRKASKMAISAAANRLLPDQRVLFCSNEWLLAGRIVGWQTDNMLPSDDLPVRPLMLLEALLACRGTNPFWMVIASVPAFNWDFRRTATLVSRSALPPRQLLAPVKTWRKSNYVELDLHAHTTSIAHLPVKQVLVQAKATRQKRCKMQTRTQGRRHEPICGHRPSSGLPLLPTGSFVLHLPVPVDYPCPV
ncbi:hypothetical protein GE09DRAFT_611634 [Coniochaeta sp. 2T2.1]|nr:hypothetical protein GE09DRAFT_611634 [Coniochaeta sp. 2T2.1]